MGNFRIGKDSMGEIEVPSNALYAAQTQRAIENFTLSSTPMPWVFLETILHIKYSAARANNELGLLTNNQAGYIYDAIDTLLVDKPLEQFPVSVFQTGSGTSTNMDVNEVIVGLTKQRGLTLSPNDHSTLVKAAMM